MPIPFSPLLDARFAYLFRKPVNENDPYEVLLAVREFEGTRPLLSMLRFLEEGVDFIVNIPKMTDLILRAVAGDD